MPCAWLAECGLAQRPVQHMRHSVIWCDAAAMSIVHLCSVWKPSPRQLLGTESKRKSRGAAVFVTV